MTLADSQIADLERLERAMYADFYAAASPQVAGQLALEAIDLPFGLRLASPRENHPFFNRVMLRRPLSADEAVEIERHFHRLQITRWMVQTPPAAKNIDFSRCRSPIVALRGWAKHVLDRTLWSAVESTAPPEDLTVRKVQQNEAAVWAEIVTQAFDFPAPCVPWLAALAARPQWKLYLAIVADQPAATGALYLNRRRAALNFGATLPEFRRRGAQSALIRHRIEDALGMGVEQVVSETDEELPERPNPSTRNLIRHGLPVVYVRPNWGPQLPLPPA